MIYIGTQYQPDGLPNIEARGAMFRSKSGTYTQIDGAFYLDYSNKFIGVNDDATGSNDPRINFNASFYNNIYGNSNFVQPKNVSILPIIKY